MRSLLVFIAFLLFIYACNVGVRYHQHLNLVSSGEVILTTHDGYRWLRYAEGDYEAGLDKLSGSPVSAAKMPDRPLLSELIRFFGGVPEITGSYLAIFLSGLFIFPLGLLFYFAGFPAAGIGACLMGSLSFTYLSRTSAFMVDTDMLNLFFISAGLLFAYLAGRGRAVLWSACAGLSMYVFWRWYFHSGFTLIIFLLLIFAIHKEKVSRVITSSVIYGSCASPFVFVSGFRNIYEFIFGVEQGGIPTYSDVAELQVLGVMDTFGYISSVSSIALIGLVLSLLMGKRVIYLLPFYLLGMFAFIKGVRYSMFLAPLCGAGVGIAFDYLFKDKLKVLGWSVVISLMMLILLKPFLSFIPPKVVADDVYTGVKHLRGLEKNAVIASIWDHGFMVEYLAGRVAMSDGATQFKEGARVFAQAIMSTDPYESAKLLARGAKDRPVYLMFTPDIDSKISQLAKTAGYDISMHNAEIFLNASDKINFKETMLFRLHILGEEGIKYFKPIINNNKGFSVYKVYVDSF